MRPKTKNVPTNEQFSVQRDMLLHPESNPTGYVPFEDAATHAFAPEAGGWSRVNAWWLADASWIAYSHDPAEVDRIFRERANMRSCELIDSRGTECYLAQHDAFAIVAFRGTQPDDWRDLFSVSRFVPVAWDVGHVHRGFAEALEAVWRPLAAALDSLPAGCRVWFTGHSLGGALAALAAFRRRSQVGGLYTFGSPRVGDGVFATQLDSTLGQRSIRYANDHDVVTHVPPEPFAFPGRYTHVRNLRWINKDGQVITTEPTVRHFVQDVIGDTAFLLDVVQLAESGAQVSLPDALADHTPLFYALHTWNDFAVHG